VGVGIGFGKDAEAEDVGDDEAGVAAAVDAKIGESVRRKALGVEGAETGLVTKERPTGHGHAPCEESFDGRVEPDDRDGLSSEKFGSAVLSVSAAAES